MTLGDKFLAAPGNRTSISGMTVRCSTNELHPHPNNTAPPSYHHDRYHYHHRYHIVTVDTHCTRRPSYRTRNELYHTLPRPPSSSLYLSRALQSENIIIIIIVNPLTVLVVGAPEVILQPVFSIFPCSPLPSGTCRTPFPDVVFPPLPLSALSSSPFHCALQDGFGQN